MWVRHDLENLRKLLGSICIRRSKSLLKCFAYKEENRRLDFTAEEYQRYKSLEITFNQAIKVAITARSNKVTHHRIMEALLRLRMFCNNGAAMQSNLRDSVCEADEVLSLLHQCGKAICGICSCDILLVDNSSKSGPVYLTQCQRAICAECIVQYSEECKSSDDASKWSCSLCHEKHSRQYSVLGRDVDNVPTERASPQDFPSKLRALLEDIQANYLQEKW